MKPVRPLSERLTKLKRKVQKCQILLSSNLKTLLFKPL
nr:MAG TPA: hypothetical protein [Caudoviricetes sp.]